LEPNPEARASPRNSGKPPADLANMIRANGSDFVLAGNVVQQAARAILACVEEPAKPTRQPLVSTVIANSATTGPAVLRGFILI
jgi:hypothetical protein